MAVRAAAMASTGLSGLTGCAWMVMGCEAEAGFTRRTEGGFFAGCATWTEGGFARETVACGSETVAWGRDCCGCWMGGGGITMGASRSSSGAAMLSGITIRSVSFFGFEMGSGSLMIVGGGGTLPGEIGTPGGLGIEGAGMPAEGAEGGLGMERPPEGAEGGEGGFGAEGGAEGIEGVGMPAAEGGAGGRGAGGMEETVGADGGLGIMPGTGAGFGGRFVGRDGIFTSGEDAESFGGGRMMRTVSFFCSDMAGRFV